MEVLFILTDGTKKTYLFNNLMLENMIFAQIHISIITMHNLTHKLDSI